MFTVNDISHNEDKSFFNNYNVRYDQSLKQFFFLSDNVKHIFKCNFLINGFLIFVHDKIVAVTEAYLNKYFQYVLGVLESGNLILNDNFKHRNQDVINALQKINVLYKKHDLIFNDHFNKEKYVVSMFCPQHFGHDLLETICNWEHGINLCHSAHLIVSKNTFYFSREELLNVFDTVDFFDDDEEMFTYICKKNYLLFSTRYTNEKTIQSKTVVKRLNNISAINTGKTLGIFLKTDNISRNCINYKDFLDCVIKIATELNYKIILFGYIKLYSEDKLYLNSIKSNQILVDSLNLDAKNILFLNNVHIQDIKTELYSLTHSISPFGTLQHISYLFSNVTKELVTGTPSLLNVQDNIWSLFKTYQNIFNYQTLPETNVDIVLQPNAAKITPRTYNYNITVNDSLMQYVYAFLN